MRIYSFQRQYFASFYSVFLTLIMFASVPISAQEGDAGLQNPLQELGAGARALSLGSAYVAMADDPSAVFWNPAGLEFIPRVSLSLFHTQLGISGLSYDFLGFAYPTLQFGTIGVGYSRIGVDNIPVSDVFGQIVDENFTFDYSEIYIAYAKKIFWGLTPGFTFKVHRQSFSFNGQDNSAFGLDGGLLYRPHAEDGLMSNLSVGFHFQNLIKPEINFSANSDTLPKKLSIGVMKGFPVGLAGKLNLLFSYDQVTGEGGSIHTGAEYSFRNRGTIRVGYDRDVPSFGAGIRYKFVNIDYAFGSTSADVGFSAQHRFSLTFNLGKSREEKVLLANEARRKREQQLVESTVEGERQRRIAEGMNKGKEYLDSGQYFDASVEFQQVIGEDPFNKTAKALFDESQVAIEREFQKRQSTALAQAADSVMERENQRLIDLFFERGRNYLQNKQYTDALIQFNLALERRPDDQVLQNAVQTTQRQLSQEIKTLVTSARSQFQQGNYSDALQVLSEALILSPEADAPGTLALKNEINSLTKRIKLQQYTIRGLALLKVGELQEALEVFKEALALDPTNDAIRQYYEQTQIEVGGKRAKMDPESERLYIEGTEHFLAGRYGKALEIWQKLVEKYPYNKRLQDAITTTEDRIKRQKNQ